MTISTLYVININLNIKFILHRDRSKWNSHEKNVYFLPKFKIGPHREDILNYSPLKPLNHLKSNLAEIMSSSMLNNLQQNLLYMEPQFQNKWVYIINRITNIQYCVC